MKLYWFPIIIVVSLVLLFVLGQFFHNEMESMGCTKDVVIEDVLQVSTGGLFTSSNCLYKTNFGNKVMSCNYNIGDKTTIYKC